MYSWQTEQEWLAKRKEHLNMAVLQIDKMLDNAGMVVKNLHPYLNKGCGNEVVVAMRKQVSTVPNVRTAAFAFNHEIYCTSIYGAQLRFVGNERYVNNTLAFMKDNSVTVHAPIVSLRHTFNNHNITIGVDGNQVNTLLRLLDNNGAIIIQIGRQRMDNDGKVHTVTTLSNQDIIVHASSNYPYQVLAYPLPVKNWITTLVSVPDLFISLTILSLFIYAITFVTLGRILTLPLALKKGLERHEFVPYFQPVVEGEGYRMAGCEVLMRWEHPRSGIIPPDHFIPEAEESGLIIPMTRQIMQHTSMLFVPVAEHLPAGFHFAFNICARHLEDLSLYEDCRQFLDSFQKQHVTLILELTEREFVKPSPLADEVFEKLGQLGVKIALDDFGTGHSSLAYLQKFHVDTIKIDQTFIRKIGQDLLSQHIVNNIVDLAKKLQKKVVAEGIENETQLKYLAANKMNYLQGYYFGKPVPFEVFWAELEKINI